MGERLVSLHLDKMVCILMIDHILLILNTLYIDTILLADIQ